MLSVAEALELIRANVPSLAPRRVALADAFGSRLAEAVTSDVDSPPYDKSVVDGYAIRFDDLRGGRAELRFLEEVTAGALPTCEVRPGTATRIMTGAPLPIGADTVVMVERSAQPSADIVQLDDPRAKLGQNIVRRGTVMRKEDVVLAAGAQIMPAAVGLLAEAGRGSIFALPRPRIAVLATGNELVPCGEVPQPGQIRNSNGPLLVASLRQAGAEAVDLGIARDERTALRNKIVQGLEADLLILSGGVSAGVLDLVPGVLAELGVREVFHKVSLKPGKPLWFGVWTSPAGIMKLVFGLPGNPVSTLVCFELFVYPSIVRLSGAAWPDDSEFLARIAEPFHHRGDRPTYWPARLNYRATDDCMIVSPLPWQGSGDLRSLAGADTLIGFPAGERRFESGDQVMVRALRHAPLYML